MATPMRVFTFCRTFGFNSWNALRKSKIVSTCEVQTFYKYSTAYGSQWDLMSAVCVERFPVVGQELTPIEKRFSEFLQQLEFERSLKSDHELRHKEDLKRAERMKKGDIDEVDLDKVTVQTAQDFEDACQDEYNKFHPASRITDADQNNDTHSLNRALDRFLFLAVSQKLGNEHRWVLPKMLLQDGETLRQAAERVLLTLCGDQLKVKFLGNAPVGFYKFKYPKSMQGEGKSVGAKVFYFRATYKDGIVIPQKDIVKDYQWLTQKELRKYFQPKYFKAVSEFLVDEMDGTENKDENEISRVDDRQSDDDKIKASVAL